MGTAMQSQGHPQAVVRLPDDGQTVVFFFEEVVPRNTVKPLDSTVANSGFASCSIGRATPSLCDQRRKPKADEIRSAEFRLTIKMMYSGP